MLSVIYANCHKIVIYCERHYAVCREYRYVECHNAEFRYAECHYAECRYAECCFA